MDGWMDGWMDRYPRKEPHENKVQVNKKRKDLKLIILCSEIPHTQIPYSVATSQLNCYKIK